jgi:hypothetical protein
MDETFELDALEGRRERRAWVLGALCLGVAFAYLPLAKLLGAARYFPGPRLALVGIGTTLGLHLPVFVGGVWALLIAPLLHARFIVPEQKPVRLLAAILLWGLPLLSFAYWLGDFRGALHAYDLCIFLFGALCIPLAIYWRTGASRVLVVGVALIAFVPLFVMEDILGPFSPLWVYASEGPGFYNLRTVCVAIALAVACLAPVPQIGRVRFRESVFRLTSVTLASLSMAIALGDWALGGVPSAVFVLSEWNWVGYLGLLYFFRRTDSFGRRAFACVVVLQSTALLIQLALIFWNPEGGLAEQSRLLLACLGLTTMGAQAWQRWGKRRFSSGVGGRSEQASRATPRQSSASVYHPG